MNKSEKWGKSFKIGDVTQLGPNFKNVTLSILAYTKCKVFLSKGCVQTPKIIGIIINLD